ncbi:MAG TPA: NADH-quinone oxidoreductase subunit D [bacterium]|nr:NADH-quinone oxidoreductase subunit D [bacterium]
MAREFIDALRERFGGDVVETHSRFGDDTATVSRAAWVRALNFLKDELRFSMMVDLCGVDYPGREERFEVVVHLRRMDDGRRARIKARIPESDSSIGSVTGVFPAADWFEREAFDLFGIRFENHPNLKRLLTHPSFVGHPLRKDYPIDRRCAIPVPDTLMDEMEAGGESRVTSNESRMYLNLGPSHPAMHGCFRVLVELEGERIKKAVPEIGYLHRCFEKEAENHVWHAVVPYTDRLNYCSPLMNNVGYCMAVEKLLDLEVPERAQWIRMLVCEISRICDHLVANGANLVDVGALTNFWYLFNVREMFTDWIEALCGARLTTAYGRIGGVARELPQGTAESLRSCIKELRRAIRQVEWMTKRNRILIERTQGVGAISEADAIGYGFTGPCLRATGCEYDVRKEHPYLRYDLLDWDVPVGHRGDTYDRIFVRFEEMKQSARMVEQILERIPPGPVMADRPDTCLPAQHEVYGSIEGMIRHFKILTDGIRVPAGEAYSYTEAANGELGFYAVSDGGSKPWRIKVRPPCFAVYQAYPKLIEDHMVADAVAVIGSLNIIAGELDR